MTLNALEALTRIRQRTHDREGYTFDDNEVLLAVDDALRKTFTPLRISGEQQALDSLDLATTDLATVDQRVLQWTVPDHVADVQLIEGLRAGARALPIPRVGLEEKDDPRIERRWHWGPKRTLQMRGVNMPFTGFRVWYARAFPPMFWVTTVGGSTTTIVTSGASAVRGALKNRDGLYVGERFESTGGSSANLGQVRTCTGFVSGTLTVDAFPASTALGTFAMIVPLPDENVDYLCWLVAEELLSRAGAADSLMVAQQKVAKLKEQFEEAARRSSAR